MSNYPVKIQAVRSKNTQDRPFVIIPVPIARAMGIQKGELVEWKIIDRSQLLMVRQPQSSPLVIPKKK